MAKRGLTAAKVAEREKVAFDMFKKDPEISAKEVRKILKRTQKFGMRLGRLYELKRSAVAGGEYTPKARKDRKGGGATHVPHRDAPARAISPAVSQAARRGHKLTNSPDLNEHPAVQQARNILEAAGFRHISIDAYLPMHYSQPPPMAVTA